MSASLIGREHGAVARRPSNATASVARMVRDAIKAIPPERIAALKAARAASQRVAAMAFDEAQDIELIALFLLDWRNDQLATHTGRKVSQLKRRLEWFYERGILEPRKDAVRCANIRAAVLAKNAERRATREAAATMRRCLGNTYDGLRCVAVFASEGAHHRMCGDCRRRI